MSEPLHQQPSTTAEEIWANNLSEERDFWMRWLTEDTFAEERALRIHSARALPGSFVEHLDPRRELYNILDVGSGPASPIGAKLEGKLVNLVLTDPLAHEYARMLDELQMFDVMRPMKVRGEELTHVFPEGYFDIVSCNNALDHCADPLSVIREMVRVCRDSGWIHISGLVNIAEFEHYQGLHQWNVDIRDGRLIVWNHSGSTDVLALVPEIEDLTAAPLSGEPPEMSLWLRVRRQAAPTH